MVRNLDRLACGDHYGIGNGDDVHIDLVAQLSGQVIEACRLVCWRLGARLAGSGAFDDVSTLAGGVLARTVPVDGRHSQWHTTQAQHKAR